MRKRIVTLLSGHSVPLVTGKVRRLDGTLLDAEIAASPFVDVEGPAIQVVLRDVTERERLRREREALQASLAQSDRLSSMGMLAAGVAHEINNPLSYVLYNVESLAEELPRLAQAVELCRAEMGRVAGADVLAEVLGNDLDLLRPANLEDMAQRLQDAVSGARQIREIARGLGTFSRVEETTHAPVNLQACIDHACIMAHNEIKYRARLVKDYAVTPPVLGSQGKLAQVLLNLLINAAHATDEGHVEDNQVRVRTSVEGDNVVVEVSDTGKGIAPEHREKVFEPFFTTKGVGVGSGLGLAICRRIMGEHNGTIELFSEVGRGTTFRLVLPRMPADWAPAGGTKGKGGALAAAAVRGRVLVVDDEVGVRQVVVRVLSKEHEVVAVSSGDEARELLQRDRGFDLIYCDLMMPRMSGMELHAWLAETDAALAGQVVFLTGGAFTPAATDYLARVGNLRVEKPFNAHDLQKLSAELVLAARAKRA
jgi:signal transduction histidine kinase/ActR/RegA family two-component response regulator